MHYGRFGRHAMARSRFLFSLIVLASLPSFGSDRLPKNMRLEIRLDQSLGSDISHEGETFEATLNRSVTLTGKEVLPKGAHVTGLVKWATSTHNYAQPGELELELTSVDANEKTYRVTTNLL